MFGEPIRHTRLDSFNELLKVSYEVFGKTDEPMILCHCNGHIAFTDSNGQLFVTPYRHEVTEILENQGEYKWKVIDVPFSYERKEKLPEAYFWLIKKAKQENWSYIYEKAKEIADQRRVKSPDLPMEKTDPSYIPMVTVHFIKEGWKTDTSEGTMWFMPMVSQNVTNWEENVGTYIILDEYCIVVCDEWGKTYFIQTKRNVSDLVNRLKDAGFYWTPHPAKFVRKDIPKA